MAKVLYSVLVSDVRGKAGNAVFSKARNGGTVRQRVTGTNPQTTRQSNARAILTSVSRKWSGVLTTSQRDDWKSAAEGITRTDPISGRQYKPSGYSYYVELTSNFLRFNPSGTPPISPPNDPFDEPTVTVTINGIDEGSWEASGSFSAATPAGTSVEILYQPLENEGRAYSANQWKSAGFASDTSTPFELTVEIPENDRNKPAYALAYRWIETATGQVGQIRVLGIISPS